LVRAMSMMAGKLICLVDEDGPATSFDGFVNECLGATDALVGKECACRF
jgi:hypothetical protein